jgi:hypothetical protein
MVTLFVFYIHTVAAATAFTRRWQDEGLVAGILGAAFVVLIFGVGWSVATVPVRWFMEPQGFGHWFDRDAFALALWTVIEGAFYITVTRRRKRRLAQAASA